MRLLTYLILTALIAGCGEVSYKRGGSQQEIEQAHRACRGSGEQLTACLETQGWQKPRIDAFDPLFATVSITDNRQASTATPSEGIVIRSDKASDMKPVTTSATTSTEDSAQPGLQIATQPHAATGTAAPASRPSSSVNDGPDVEYAINSWWKIGAFPDQLKQDQRACEKKLGVAYLPDYSTQTYKRAFVACMHDAGWMAIRNIK